MRKLKRIAFGTLLTVLAIFALLGTLGFFGYCLHWLWTARTVTDAVLAGYFCVGLAVILYFTWQESGTLPEDLWAKVASLRRGRRCREPIMPTGGRFHV